MKHYLSIQRSKNVYWRDDLGVIRTLEKLRHPAPLQLEPLLVLGVFVESVPLKKIQYCAMNEPKSVRGLLESFWYDTPTEKGIIGKPEALIVDRRLYKALSNDLLEWLDSISVLWEWSDGKDRKFSAKTRQMQDFPSMCLLQQKVPGGGFLTVQMLNQMLNQMLEIRQTGALKKRFPTTSVSYPIEYDPYGEALSAANNNDLEAHELTIVSEGGEFPVVKIYSGLSVDEQYFQDCLSSIAKVIIDFHPLKVATIAEKIGSKTKDLTLFLNNQGFWGFSPLKRQKSL